MNTFNEFQAPDVFGSKTSRILGPQFDETAIGLPNFTSTPLSKRQSPLAPSQSGPEPQVTVSILPPGLPPAYFQPAYYPGAYSSPFSAYSRHLPPSPTYITQSGISPVVPIQSVPRLPSPIQSVPVSPAPIQSVPVSPSRIQSVPIFPPPIQSVPVSPSQFQSCVSPTPATTSPVSESRPLDFLTLPRSPENPDIGHKVDEAIVKLLADPTDKISHTSSLPASRKSSASSTAAATVSSRRSSLERRLLALQPCFPTQDLLTFLRVHIASIQRERDLCLRDGLFPADYTSWLAQRYTEQLHLVLNSVERNLQVLEQQRRSQHGRSQERSQLHANRALDPKAVRLMEAWFRKHPANLYPTHTEAGHMADEGGITVQQLRKWFANKRHRSRKAMEVPARQFEEFVSKVFLT